MQSENLPVENSEIAVVGDFAATLSLIEIGLGSFLHSLHVPFAGLFLSLNQGYMLTRASLDFRSINSRWIPYQISNVAAVLKSFSPAGKKLGPMLSLSMQGLLFNLGIRCFGINVAGLSVGMILLSLWGFCQPVITYYFFFGQDLFNAFSFMFRKVIPYPDHMGDFLIYVLITLIIVKALVGILLVILACKSQKGLAFQEKMLVLGLSKNKKTKPDHSRHPAFLALKDLLKPLFLISFAMTAVFLYYTEHSEAETIWILLRPLGFAFIFFYFSRTLTLDRWLLKIENGKGRTFALTARRALEKIRSVL